MRSCYRLSQLCLRLPAAIAVHSVGVVQTSEAAGAAAALAAKPDAGVTRVEVRGDAAAYDARKYDTAAKVVVTYQELIKYGDTSVIFRRRLRECQELAAPTETCLQKNNMPSLYY